MVAIVDSGPGRRGPEACRGIAAELAASGSRVVIVNVEALLRTNRIPEVNAFVPGRAPNVSLWPPEAAAPVEFFQSPTEVPASEDWLGSLRQGFDSVILDCPAADSAPAAAGIAAIADATVLVVEARRTSKRQIQRTQRTLQLRGAKLAGFILMRKR